MTGKNDAIQVLALDIDGVLTNGRVELDAHGEERKALAFRDLDALGAARRAGIQIALVTGEDGPLVDIVARRVQAQATLRGAKDKGAAITELAGRLHTPLSRICYVGDADRDAPALEMVGLGLAPSDASAMARGRANRVLSRRGGEGAVAEAVELCLGIIEAAEQAGSIEQRLCAIANESLLAHRALIDEGMATLREVALVFTRALGSGHKILLCGNGGSAADAQHVAAELVGRFSREREPWPVLALNVNTSAVTAIANDWEYAEVFARQVRAFARPGDVVVGISTSGRSANVQRALEAGRALGAICVGFTGSKGRALADHCDVCFAAPSDSTPRIQELHILAWHAVCDVVEERLCESESRRLAPELPHSERGARRNGA
jgi:D-sedoheptulose 7-phosphate isomerase